MRIARAGGDPSMVPAGKTSCFARPVQYAFHHLKTPPEVAIMWASHASDQCHHFRVVVNRTLS